eukprot:TRINITY_DN2062_c1_g1_i1.p1 TRINITY_DN2062_c1_g1~~TRINITY_DN2062_c1_g1_i1.p1  ORF type:complete len:575 (+),score=149.24 TRINITY_DN2062_c1_g1_i1:32-1756(+)
MLKAFSNVIQHGKNSNVVRNDILKREMSSSNRNRYRNWRRRKNALNQSQLTSFSDNEAKALVWNFPDDLVRMVKAVNTKTSTIGAGEDNVSYHSLGLGKGIYAKLSVVRAEPALFEDQVLKLDHWEGNQILRGAPEVIGAPNFRRIPDTILFGVGQPTSDGLDSIFKILSSTFTARYASKLSSNDISTVNDNAKDSAVFAPSFDKEENISESENDLAKITINSVENAKVEGTEKLEGSVEVNAPKEHKAKSRLRKVGAIQNDAPFTKVLWINLREEPVIYIEGKPYAPRDKETLNVNLDHLIGIEGLDLENMEQILKADVSYKALQDGKKIEVKKQEKEMNNVTETLNFTPGTAQTPRELWEGKKRVLPLQYARVPITDECAPQERDLEELVFLLKDLVLLATSSVSSTRTAVVFNCQLGRGRTTTGLVCAYLIMYVHLTHLEESLLDTSATEGKSDGSPDYLNGEYSVVTQLVSLLQDGQKIKNQVDRAIDACSQVQNLREAIFECRQRSLLEDENSKKYEERGLNYLERYWWLIVFNAYLAEQAPLGFKENFSVWMSRRWDYKRLLKKLSLN